jgi:hypothetical protein
MYKKLIVALSAIAIILSIGMTVFVLLNPDGFSVPGGRIGIVIDLLPIAEIAAIFGLFSYMMIQKNKNAAMIGISISLFMLVAIMATKIFNIYDVYFSSMGNSIVLLSILLLAHAVLMFFISTKNNLWSILKSLTILSIILNIFVRFYSDYSLKAEIAGRSISDLTGYWSRNAMLYDEISLILLAFAILGTILVSWMGSSMEQKADIMN